ncbi:MAG: DUF5686 and carboxypeptidase regulatory-like domain-containing protein, partial [Bacteroidales bacterium]|nr:DUF5686 and carboxypeptidase regulatory-like domain-containing protein [Bacteroidales bacterium]
MIRYPIILTLLFTLISSINAQSLKGKIINSEGKPVSYATVYINELKHGTTANIKGEYILNLKPGSYTIFYQSLGFSPTVKNVTISNADKNLNITLQIQYYEIPEVRVTSTGEDPAYAIMRKAIGLAPYYLNLVKHYEAEIYIKGSIIVRKIPKIMEKRLIVNDEKIKEGDVFFIESINEIEFNAPDKYDQRVISQQSTFPESGETDISPMDVVKASFYEPVLADVAISPLSPNAMAHYKFSYKGSSPQGTYIVNKISVIPRRKSQQVFFGTIYIIEDLWCLHSLDLTNENLAGSININQVYTPVQDNIWMPVSHNFVVNISVVGVIADGEYGSAVTYKVVDPNNELKKPEVIKSVDYLREQTDEVQAELTKEQAKIEEILSKNELSNRDMAKLSRLMEKETTGTDNGKEELEIKETRSFTVDANARDYDSTYWNSIRPIPLSDDEMRSVRVNDSIKTQQSLAMVRKSSDTTAAGGSTKASTLRVLRGIGFGKTYYSKDKLTNFRHGGLINVDKISFNSVNGFTYGTDFRLSKWWKDGPRMRISPSVNYGFASNKLFWKVDGLLDYNHLKQSRLIVWGGKQARDYNRSAGIASSLNMYTSLFLKNNYLKLYESSFLSIDHRQEYFNGFYVTFRYNYEKRNTANNSTQFSFLKKDELYEINRPSNPCLPDLGEPDQRYALVDHTHHSGSVLISYIPRQRYRITDKGKSPAGSSYPTFKLHYIHGLTIFDNNERENFDFMKIEINKSKNIGAFSEYSWRFRAGGFINNQGVQFQDFVH